MKTFRLKVGLILLLGFMHHKASEAQTIVRVNGFDLDRSGYAYTFLPTIGGRVCDPWELDMYLFEWQFSETDYSLEPTPTRDFIENVDEVILRVTGIKQLDDPDKEGPRVALECLPPCKRTTKYISQTSMGIEANPTFSTAGKPIVAFGDFGRPPVPNDSLTIPMVFSGSEGCDLSLQITLTGSVVSVGQPISCYRPPCEAVPPSHFEYTFRLDLPRNTRKVVLAKAALDSEVVSRPLLLTMLVSEHGSACKFNPDTVSTSLTIKRAIDPNYKNLANGPIFDPGDPVEYIIKFENLGETKERFILMLDTLDKRFDFENASIHSVSINGVQVPKRSESFSRNSYFLPLKHNRVIGVLTFLKEEEGLAKGDTGEITLMVPIRTDTDFVSTISFHPVVKDSNASDSTCIPIPNHAWTLFLSETTISGNPVWHLCESNMQACVVPNKVIVFLSWLKWAGIGLILVVFSGLLMRSIRLRNRNRS